MAKMEEIPLDVALKRSWRKGYNEGYITGGGFVKVPSNVEVDKLIEETCGEYEGEDRNLCIMGLLYGITAKTEDIIGTMHVQWEIRGYEEKIPFDVILKEAFEEYVVKPVPEEKLRREY